MILVKHSITAVGTKSEGRNPAVDTEVKAASAERRAVSLQNVLLFLELAVQAQGRTEDSSAHWYVAIENVPLLIPLRCLSLLLLLLLCYCLQSASFRQAGSESPETAARCCKAGGSRKRERRNWQQRVSVLSSALPMRRNYCRYHRNAWHLLSSGAIVMTVAEVSLHVAVRFPL